MHVISGGKTGPTQSDLIIKHLGFKRTHGRFFAEVRLAANLSYRDIEERIGLQKGEYPAWESGFRCPSNASLVALLSLLGMEAKLKFNVLFTENLAKSHEYRSQINNPIIS